MAAHGDTDDASRLPKTIIPQHYELTLTPDLENFTFEGSVVIDVNTTSELDKIELNSLDIDIKDGMVENEDGSITRLNKTIYNVDEETAFLHFQRHVKPRKLSLNFTGVLNDKMVGFYRTSFKIGKKTVHAATSKFEPNYARRALPCFDEPALKATFGVTLIYDATPIEVDGKKYKPIALSNGEIESEKKRDDGKIVAKFELSPKMSTYLLAFIVGPFEFIETKSSSGCKVRVYARPGKKEEGQFALDLASKSLDYYEDYFGIRYPMKKLDCIAIPDFMSGAMENWGLITYRETSLLYYPEKTSNIQKQYIATCVTHEIAHQWFGNLVTMEWWTHLWLNEGFASFMEVLCANKILPEFNLWPQFVISDFSPALKIDALRNSHPIEVPVKHTRDITHIFDFISYHKGSSVIRMLYEYLGDDVFRAGMKSYLTKFAYQNAFTEDLWDALGQASKKPIRKIMSAWTGVTGYPWIDVKLKNDNDSEVVLTLTQSKFTANGDLAKEDVDQIWMIPLTIKYGSADKEPIKLLLDKREDTVTLPKEAHNWLKLNWGSVGFFRIAYPPELLNKLSKIIHEDHQKKLTDPKHIDVISDVDRLSIQDDYFALCQAGKLQTTQLLTLLKVFKEETSYTVWSTIDDTISSLTKLFKQTKYQEPFFAFAQSLYVKIHQKSGWEVKQGENHNQPMLRALAINRLIKLNHEATVKKALQLFDDQVHHSKLIGVDLRGVVYMAVSNHGTDKQYEELFNIFEKDDSQGERNRVVKALGSAQDVARLERAYEFAISDNVRNQDKTSAIQSIGSTNPTLAWKLFKKHQGYFKKIYENGRLMSSVIKFSTQFFTKFEEADDIETFFKENHFPGSERTVNQSLETIRLNAKWFERLANETSLIDFLRIEPPLI